MSAPINLYIDLEDGARADLEVASRAAIAFAEMIREIGFIIDPSLEIRLELISSTEGSLAHNSILKAVHPKTWATKPNLVTIIALAIAMIRHETVSYAYQHVMDFLLGQSEHHLSPEDANEIAKHLAQYNEKAIAIPQIENLFRTLELDPGITGVGANQMAGTRPPFISPRKDFKARSGVGKSESVVTETRSTDTRQTLTIVRPVLLDAPNRRWGFRSAHGDFGATVKDGQFLARVLEGRTGVPLVAGIQLEVTLRVVEEKKSGVWHETDHTVLLVHRIISPMTQVPLDLPASKQLP